MEPHNMSETMTVSEPTARESERAADFPTTLEQFEALIPEVPAPRPCTDEVTAPDGRPAVWRVPRVERGRS